MIREFWDAFGQKVGRTARTGLVLGSLGIVLGTVLMGYWLLRTDYQVLFTDLTPQDAAAMTAELDRLKTPFTVSDQGSSGTTILVDRGEVHKTRIKLMGKDIPLHGAIGFELFNNSDFGMTEFAQKINYQRALQGELTRTILSLAEVKDARVLLALPEQGLFKQAGNKPKASVTIAMKPGQHLRSEQVAGIQRLVAAAVPGITSQDVTLVDQSGVALSLAGVDGTDMASGSGSLRLDLKKEIETYLSHKASEVLDRALGAGQAMASVDVTLDLDRVQSNTDEILAAPTDANETPTGIIVHQRETSRESSAPLNARTSDVGGSAPGDSRQSESDYIVGHRIEQIFRHPGSIQRMKVAVVTQKELNSDQQENLRKMVSACIGVSSDRGDEVVVLTTQALAPGLGASAGPNAPAGSWSQVPNPGPGSLTSRNPVPPFSPGESVAGLLPGKGLLAAMGVLLGGICLGCLAAARRRVRAERAKPTAMTEEEREAVLAQVEAWLRRPLANGIPGDPLP